MKRIAAISEADLPAASEAQLLSAIDLLQSELDDALKHAQMPSSSPAERQHAIRQSESLHIELALHQRFLALRQQMGDGPVIAERPSGSQNSLNAASQDSLVEELEQMLSSKGTINGEASNAVQPSDSANSTALERLKASGKALPTLAAASRLTAAVQALAVGGELSSGSGAQDAEIPATAAEQSIPASSNDNERLPAVEWHALRRLSTHLYSTAVQTSVGLPTTLAVNERWLAVGTSRGWALLYDRLLHYELRVVFASATFMPSSGSAKGGDDTESADEFINGVTAVALPENVMATIEQQHNQSIMCCGYAQGEIKVWQVPNLAAAEPRRLIREPLLIIRPQSPDQPVAINRGQNGHLCSLPITRLSLIPSPQRRQNLLETGDWKLISGDCTGKVCFHALSRRSLLFSSSLAADSYMISKAADWQPIGSMKFSAGGEYFAVISQGKLSIISVEPQLCLRFTLHAPPPPVKSPSRGHQPPTVCCASWCPTFQANSNNAKQTRAALCCAWDNELILVSLIDLLNDSQLLSEDHRQAADGDEFQFQVTWRQRIGNGSRIAALEWLPSNYLMAVTVRDELLVFRPQQQQLSLIEKMSIDKLEPILQDFSLPAWAKQELIDRRVPSTHAASLLTTDSYSHCISATAAGELFVLGKRLIARGRLYSWQERLQQLAAKESIFDAVYAATKIYRGEWNMPFAVRPEDENSSLSENVRRYAMEIIADYLTAEIGSDRGRRRLLADSKPAAVVNQRDPSPYRITAGEGAALTMRRNFYNDLLVFIVESCLMLDSGSFLLSHVYPAMKDLQIIGVFFDALAPFIMDGRLTELHPLLARELMEHYRLDERQSDRLEQCILRFDLSVLDIHLAVTVCKELRLYAALIHLHNRVFDDFVGPLHELICLAGKSTFDSNSSPYLAYAYLSHVFAGRYFPGGSIIPAQRLRPAKIELLSLIFCSRIDKRFPLPLPKDDRFPYLTIMLRFDAPEFFRWLFSAIDDPLLDEGFEWRLPQASAQAASADSDGKIIQPQSSSTKMDRQYIIDSLFKLCRSSSAATSADGVSPVNPLFCDRFIAKCLAKHRGTVVLTENSVRQLLDDLLSVPVDLANEHAILLIITSQAFWRDDENRLLPRLESKNYWRAAEPIYLRRRRFDKILLCRVNAAARSIHNMHNAADGAINESLEEGTMALIDSFRVPDSDNAITSAKPYSDRERRDFRQALQMHAETICRVLHEKFPIAINRLAPELHVKILDRLKDPHDRLVYLSGRLRVCNDLNNPVADLPQFIHETANQVCELMCQLKQPESEILLFVQRVANEKLLRSLLTVLKRYDVFEPIIWILQTIGDEREAIKLVRDRLMRLPATSPVPEQLSGLSERLLDTGMQVCRHFSASQQRCEQVPQGKQQDNPWFLLLDAFIAFQGSLESPDPSSFVKQSLDQSLQKLLAAMMSHVQDIVGVIYRLMMDGTAQEKPLIDYKDLLLSVLSAHDNQRAILQSTAQIGEWFAVQSLSLRYAKQRKFRPVKSGDVCVSCSRRLVQPMAAGIHSNSSSSSRDTGLFLLGCGHIFHGKCLLLGCNAINNSQQLECPYCGVAILSSSQLSLFSDTGATAADEKLRRQVEAFYLYTAAHQKRKLDSRNS